SFPEYVAMVKHKAAGRVSLDGLARETGADLAARYNVDFGLEFNSNGLFLADTAALQARGVKIDSLARTLAAKARDFAGVAAVYTPKTLAAAPETDIAAARWRRAIPKETSWLFAGATKPGYIWSVGRLIAEHGTMNDDNVSVPIAFWGPGIAT